MGTQRELHYQIARFCLWEDIQRDHYRYKIAPAAIRRAKTQHISTEQIRKLFEKYTKKPVPKNIFTALTRWNKKQSQIKLEKKFIIRVSSSGILDLIEKSSIKQYIRERVNATTAIVAPNDIHRLEDALIEMGYFAEILREV